MKKSPAFIALSLLGLFGADAAAADRPHLDAWASARAPVNAAAATGAVAVLAHDPRGVPSLVHVAPGSPAPSHFTAAQAARHHLQARRGLYRVNARVISGARDLFTHDTGRGAVIASLRQTVGGVDVFHGDLKILMDRDHRLLGIAGAPHPAAHVGAARPFARDRVAAVRTALADLYGAELAAPVLRSRGARGGWERFDLGPTTGLRFDRPARVKRVYFPLGDSLLPAHLVELQASAGNGRDVYQYVVSADDGRILYRNDATADDAYQYRVFADTTGDRRPQDGPVADWTPHPTGTPEGGPVPHIAPALITMEGFNHNPDDQPDPWLPPGATETLGNNVDAYADHSNPNGLSMGEYRADVTAPGVFDRTYDPLLEPLASQDQSKAAVTQLFYTINWLHDWWYDSGFDEAAGNAQADNYGRGGEQGDVLLAEAQDAALLGTRNNANMSTPLDGESPRMQMYLWTPLVKSAGLDVQPLNQSFSVGLAAFGPKNYDVTAELVLVDDGVGPNVNDGCTAPQDLTGKIALVDRGNCTFEIKSKSAEAAGAVGVLIANNMPGGLAPGADPNTPDPVIPVQGLSQADGAALKAALQNGKQTAHMSAETGVERDGTIDNLIVGHEWGHYIHHRLVDCGSKSCRAMSEGWGDWVALHMSLREGDDLAGTYAASVYAAFDVNGYFGIRRVPYSIAQDKNALSFRHIAKDAELPQNHPMAGGPADNSEVHNAGEIWATMLWEAYIALHSAHEGDMTFDEVRRLMGDYIVGGMMMAPVEPTFTQQRDAILMVVAANDKADLLTVAQAFAKRGAGTCAVSPAITSTDFNDVVENFELGADNTLTGVTVDDDVVSCDDDGVVDAKELGTIHVGVFNRGPVSMPAGTVVEVVDPDPALAFPNGPSVQLGAIAPLGSSAAGIQVAVADNVGGYQPVTLTVRVTSPEGCQEFVEQTVPIVIHGDVDLAASSVDDVEVDAPAWIAGGTEPGVWARDWDDQGYFWHGADTSHASDTWLESPDLDVGDEPFVVTFDHAYSFEYSDNTYWDGGIIEITSNEGKTWTDVSDWVDPGYGGDINSAANPLDGRAAFVDKNAMYPAFEEKVLDFGTAFAGQQVRLRFRIGTDAAAGGPGWDLDNLAFAGITNTPFATWIDHQAICNEGETTDGETTDSTGGTTDSTGTTDGGSDSTAGTTDGVTDSTGGTTDSTTDGTSGGTSNTGTTSSPTSGNTSGNTTDEPPTTSATDSGSDSGPNTSLTGATTPDSAGSDGSSGTDGSEGTSEGQTGTDDGCACTSGNGRGLLWQLVPTLGLLALRRRRA